MNNLNENDIGTLLRLKRHEQPPPGYFDNFLHEFHRRQRAELLRQPLWRICLQRAQDSMFQLNIPALSSYPMAAAAMLVCAAVLALKVSQGPENPNMATVVLQENASAVSQVTGDSAWSLSSPVATRDFSAPTLRTVSESAQTHRTAAPPRYVLDSTPVSYEVSLRF